MSKEKKFYSAASMYDKHVAFAAYGDDHFARVSNVVFPWFNMLSIQRKMAEYGVEYTSPDKSKIMPAELADGELTYLKRSFVSRSGRVDAPLPLERVLDILSWVRGDDVSRFRESIACAVRSVLIELTHHGRVVFETWYPQIVRVCAQNQIDCPITNFDETLDVRLHSKMDTLVDEF